jgi:hypothetical protein
MKFKSDIEIQAGVEAGGSTGSNGQVLSSTGSGVAWINQSAITAASDFVFFNVKNETGSTILKGKGIMAVGTDGNSGHILIDEMVANGTVEAKYFLGVLEENIVNGGFARVISFGQLAQFNTNGQNGETWNDGQILWCDPANPGDFTITEPDGPNVKIAAAFILNSSTNGKIQIRVQANEGIHDLHDTKITSQVDGDVLVWDNTTGVWFNDSTLNVDYTNGRVGIGTTSPAKKLTIGGIGLGNTDGLKIEDPSNTAYGAHYSYDDSSSSVEIGGVTNNTLNDCISIDRDATRTITINASRNVGINTTSPNQKLHVNGATQLGDINATTNFGTVALKVVEGTVSTGPTLGSGTVGAQAVLYSNGAFGMYTGVSGTGNTWMQSQRNDANTATYSILLNPLGGNVGIGTSVPQTKLEVSGIASFTGSGGRSVVIEGQGAGRIDINGNNGGGYAVGIRFNSSSGGTALSGIWNFGSGTSQQWLALGGTAYNNSAMYILPSGNVGIGTSSPSGFLTLSKSGETTFDITDIGGHSKRFFVRNSDKTLGIYNNDTGQQRTQFRLLTGTGATNDRLSLLEAGGNVGIGTTSPLAKLHISGVSGEIIRLADSSTIGNPFISFFQTSTRRSYVQHVDSGDNLTLASEYGGIVFMTGTNGTETEKMRITSSGEVGIGTSALGTPAYGSPPQLVVASSTGGVMDLRSSDANIVANDRFGRLQFSGKDDTSVGYATAAIEAVAYSTAGTGNGGGGILKFMTANFATANPPTERMRITQNGLVGIGTTNPGAKLDVSGDFNVTDSTSYLQVDSTGVNAEGYNVTGQNSGLELQDSVAKIGLDLSNSFVGLNVQTGLGAWLENEGVYKFGIAPTLNELTSAGLVQTDDTPNNDSRIEGWIKIYDENSGQMFFMPVYL